MSIRITKVALLTFGFVCPVIINPIVIASDQADYLAPYITFEDGKLVTIDPSKDLANNPSMTHSSEDQSADTSQLSTTPSVASGVQARDQGGMLSNTRIFIAASVVMLVIVVFIFYRVRSKYGVTSKPT
jgi:hypothetical protein